MNTAGAIAEALAKAGIKKAFGLPGGEVLVLIDELRKAGVDFVLMRHEANAGILIVARRTAEGFTEERRYEISHSPTWSVPVMLPGGMIVRDAAGVVKLLWE